jgi:N-acetylneuraminic acid mutarotase
MVLLYSCKEKPEPPVISTNNITSISTDSAVSGGAITNEGGAEIFERGICINKSGNPSLENSLKIEAEKSLSFTCVLSQLLPGTTYYVCAYAINVAGTGYGKTITFTTKGDKPYLTVQNPTNVQLYSATLIGSVNPNLLPTNVSFEWGKTLEYGEVITLSQTPMNGDNYINLTSSISDLTPGTTYHFRLKAENSLGMSYSSDISFKTLGDIPSVPNFSKDNIGLSTASLSGFVNPNYLLTNVTFEWGTTTNYGNNVASQNQLTGNTNLPVSVNLTGLASGTTYHVRIKAENMLGAGTSNDITFKTKDLEWTDSPAFPGMARLTPLSFTYNGKGYYGLGKNPIGTAVDNLHDFWTYDPVSSSWTRLHDCPFELNSGLSRKCLVGSTLYVFKEWALYSYDINSDTWSYIRSSSIPLSDVSAFSVNGKAFFFRQNNSELYEIIQEDNSFRKKSAVLNNYSNWLVNEIFVIQNEAYLLHKDDIFIEIYHYIAASDTWEKKLQVALTNIAFSATSFIITGDNCAFIGQSSWFISSGSGDSESETYSFQNPSSNVWKYDPVKNELRQCEKLPGVFRSYAGSLSFDHKGYIIGGATVDSNSKIQYLNDILVLNF